MHAAALLLPVCLGAVGTPVVLGPASPVNMSGATESPMEPLGPLFLESPSTVGADTVQATVLGGSSVLALDAAPQPQTGVHLEVRTTVVVVAASYGLTDALDASLVLPIVEETLTLRARVGPVAGHTTVSAAGVSDLSARLKYQLLPDVAATLQATFPTGDASRGLGTGHYWLLPGLAADLPLGDRVLLSAQVAGNLNLSYTKQSGLTYGVGVSTLLGPVGVVAELLGSVGVQNALSLFGVQYGDGATVDLALGLRLPLPHGFMVFLAGTYAVDHDGVRPAGVSPVLGVGWDVP